MEIPALSAPLDGFARSIALSTLLEMVAADFAMEKISMRLERQNAADRKVEIAHENEGN
jgi:hypothetical protein